MTALRPSLLAIAAFCLAVVCGDARAENGYHFETWTTGRGLPQNTVYDVLQTRDGYVWATTFDGLVRFDGVRFVVFDSAATEGLASTRFLCLFEASDGALWIGSEDGGLSELRDGHFRTYTSRDGLPDDTILRVEEDADGTLWVQTYRGAARRSGDRFVAYDAAADPAFMAHPAARASKTIEEIRRHGVWYADDAAVHRFARGRWTSYPRSGGLEGARVTSIEEGRDGSIWVTTADAGLFRFEAGRMARYDVGPGLERASCAVEDASGALWLRAPDGRLARFADGRLTTFGDDGANGAVCSLLVDREGSLWVGTRAGGLRQVTAESVTVLDEANGLATANVYPIVETRDGTVWAGTWGRGVARLSGGRFETFPNGARREPFAITSIADAGDGSLWVAAGASVFRFRDGRYTEAPLPFDPPPGTLWAIYVDRAGMVWFGGRAGLYRYDGTSVRHYGVADGLAGNAVKVMLEDRSGALWIGTYGGLSRLENGRITSITTADGLSSDRVRSLYESPDGVLWAGTYDGGLNRIEGGRIDRITATEGLFGNNVFQILEDDAENLWMTSNRGIFRAARRELDDVAAGRASRVGCVGYGPQDGLANVECNGGVQSPGCRSADGRLWFPTQGGVAVVDPSSLRDNRLAPSVVIESCTVAGREALADGRVDVGSGEGTLDIRFTAPSFLRPDAVAFRYRIEGLDDGWTDLGTRRSILFPYLPAGRFTLRVIAANGDGVWNATGASLVIVVAAPFYRSTWFYGVAAFGVALAGFAAFALRIRALGRARGAQEAFSKRLIESQEGERKRIAAELHDGLGQALLVIRNTAALGLEAAEPGEHAVLGEIASVSAMAIDEVRAIAYKLRPQELDRLGLSRSIEAMVRRAGESTDVRFDVLVDPIDGAVSEENEIALYRIVQEAVSNVVRHARATRASVHVLVDEGAIRVTVADDGVGFDRADGFGLSGMTERARMLGARLEVTSASGRGTTVRVVVPERRRA